MTDAINIFVPTFRVDECLEEVRECLERGWTGMGFKTNQFEEEWREFSGHENSVFLSSATAALHTALEVLKAARGWNDGDEVITTPLTFVSTNHSILHARLKPVFADVDEFLCLDPDAVQGAIGPRTRAVIFVGLGGSTGRFDEVVEICRAHGLALILDGAHMAGTRLNGRTPGLDADAACYSFQAVKNLPTGDSGLVAFREPRLAEEARKFSWLGISKDTYARSNSQTYAWYYDVEQLGYKYNGNSVMAALALVGLRYLEVDNGSRRKMSETYDLGLRENGRLAKVPVPDGCLSSRHLYQVLVRDRDELVAQLNAEGINPSVHYRDNRQYRMYQQGFDTCPNATRKSAELLSLPLHLRLTEEDVLRVVEAMNRLTD
jgi:dTDP-4-amino-4,6-dideoxygalactose transaminase